MEVEEGEDEDEEEDRAVDAWSLEHVSSCEEEDDVELQSLGTVRECLGCQCKFPYRRCVRSKMLSESSKEQSESTTYMNTRSEHQLLKQNILSSCLYRVRRIRGAIIASRWSLRIESSPLPCTERPLVDSRPSSVMFWRSDEVVC